jgi:hypothetical protein
MAVQHLARYSPVVTSGGALWLGMATLALNANGCAAAIDWNDIQAGTAAGYDQVVLNEQGLRAYFPLTDAPGSTGAKDLKNGGMTSIALKNVSFTGTSAQFDGKGYIELENAASFDFLLGQSDAAMGLGLFSLEAWILPSAGGAAPVNVFGQGTVDVGYNVTVDTSMGGEVTMGLSLSGAQNSCGTAPALFTPGQGFYFVGEFDGQQFDVYVDGVDNNYTGCGNGAAGTAAMPAMPGLYLGSDANGNSNFVGTISHVAIYDGALLPMQIQAHYAAGGNGP